MKKLQDGFALALAAALLVGAVVPSTVLADTGTDGPRTRIYDPGTDFPPEYEYGDPDPGGGRPTLWSEPVLWRQILLTSMRLRFGVDVTKPLAREPRVIASPSKLWLGGTK